MFFVTAEFHMVEGWEQIDVSIIAVVNRPAYFAGVGDHMGIKTRYLEWHETSLHQALHLKESLERITGVSVFVREG